MDQGGGTGRLLAVAMLAVLGGAFAVAPARGAVVLPNAYAYAEGPGGQGILQLDGPGATEQVIYDNAFLAANGIVAGTVLSGLALRLDTFSFGFQAVSYGSFSIGIGIAALTAAGSAPVFASNVQGGAGGVTNVRSGPLSFAAFSYPMFGAPNGFGPMITFDTPFTYTGAGTGLVFEFRHTGADHFVYGFDAFQRGSLPGVASYTALDPAATQENGDPTPSIMTPIFAVDVAEPATMTVLGLGLAGLAGVRRRR